MSPRLSPTICGELMVLQRKDISFSHWYCCAPGNHPSRAPARILVNLTEGGKRLESRRGVDCEEEGGSALEVGGKWEGNEGRVVRVSMIKIHYIHA